MTERSKILPIRTATLVVKLIFTTFVGWLNGEQRLFLSNERILWYGSSAAADLDMFLFLSRSYRRRSAGVFPPEGEGELASSSFATVLPGHDVRLWFLWHVGRGATPISVSA